MREKSTGRIVGGAGVVGALAAVGTLFAGAGLIGDGVGSFDLWPDWSGTPRPSVEVAARSPDGPGVNPLLPLTPRADGRRAVGSATAVLVVRPTTFSAGPDVATAGLVFALTPLTLAPALGASSSPSLDPGVDVPTPAAPSAPAAQPAPAAPAPATAVPVSEPAQQPRAPAGPPPAEREQVASVPPRDRPSHPSRSGSSKASSAGAAGGHPRPVSGRDGSASPTPPPSQTAADSTSGESGDGGPEADGEPEGAPLPEDPSPSAAKDAADELPPD